MNTPTIFPQLDHDHHRSTNITTTTTTITALNNPVKLITTTKAEPLSSKLKRVRKKRNAGKKDRQSKIHTAQGLRDRRMRLSVHTARKFFDLNDMLGFDKASKTIEWLFNKSHKAIQEVAETIQSDGAAITGNRENNVIGSPLSACETKSVMEVATATDKDENLKLHGYPIDDEYSRKPTERLATEGAEARAGARIRDRIMIKNLEKKKQLFDANPDDNNMEESSCYPVEFSNTYHFLKHLHLDNTVRNTNVYIPSTNHSIFDYSKSIAEPPACLLNSRNPLSGFLEGWNSVNSRMDSNNRIVPNFVPFRGNMSRENPSSSDMISSSFINFSSENRGL